MYSELTFVFLLYPFLLIIESLLKKLSIKDNTSNLVISLVSILGFLFIFSSTLKLRVDNTFLMFSSLMFITSIVTVKDRGLLNCLDEFTAFWILILVDWGIFSFDKILYLLGLFPLFSKKNLKSRYIQIMTWILFVIFFNMLEGMNIVKGLITKGYMAEVILVVCSYYFYLIQDKNSIMKKLLFIFVSFSLVNTLSYRPLYFDIIIFGYFLINFVNYFATKKEEYLINLGMFLSVVLIKVAEIKNLEVQSVLIMIYIFFLFGNVRKNGFIFKVISLLLMLGYNYKFMNSGPILSVMISLYIIASVKDILHSYDDLIIGNHYPLPKN